MTNNVQKNKQKQEKVGLIFLQNTTNQHWTITWGERGHVYREGEVEDFLDEVGGRNGAEHPLDAVLLLLHVCLFVELKSRVK